MKPNVDESIKKVKKKKKTLEIRYMKGLLDEN